MVVAPRQPQQRGWWSWWSRLRELGESGGGDSLNPLGLDPAAALGLTARDDSALAFARVEFGSTAHGQPEAFSFTSDGHPILWLWSAQAIDIEALASAYSLRGLAIDWGSLMPASLMLTRLPPRIGFHRGGQVSPRGLPMSRPLLSRWGTRRRPGALDPTSTVTSRSR